MAGKFIILVGCIGSGKSSVVQILAKRPKTKIILMDELYQENPFSLTLADRPRWSLASDLWFLQRRLALYQNVPRLLEKYSVAVDSGLPMSLAYAQSRLASGFYSADEATLFFELADELLTAEPIPDVIINLQASLPAINERIRKRGRAFESGYSTEYLQNLTAAIKIILQRYRQLGTEIITLDTSNNDIDQTVPALAKQIFGS